MIPLLSKQSRVLGLPIGRRHTDWIRVGKLAAMGVGAISTAAGGVGAKRVGGRLKDKATEGAQSAKQTMETVGKVANQASSIGETLTGGGKSDGGGDNVKKLRLIIKESIDVGVPLKTAYNQWTQFAEMPSIMKAPQSVEHEADDEARWVAKIGPSRRSWTAKIMEQNPDERIVWESTDGTENRGVVTFHRLDHNLTRVQVEMEYFPQGFVEKVGNIFLAARRRTRSDLRLFKHYLELAGTETGEWRGEISAEDQEESGEQAEEPTQEGTEQGRREGDGSSEHDGDKKRAKVSKKADEGSEDEPAEGRTEDQNEREATTA